MKIIMRENSCGECTACCKVLPIDSRKALIENEIELFTIDSPEGELCTHCDNNIGCTVHKDRPRICRTFECVYLEDGYDISLRPDRSGVIFEKIRTKVFFATVDKDFIDKWATPQMLNHIKSLNNDGISVIVSSFHNGLIDVYCAESHNKDTVLEFALENNF